MRIVAGHLKGRPVVAPKTTQTRPTSDRARETLFNILSHSGWSPPLAGARIMDVFAGSGALGFEALSRGAGFCLLVETANAARSAIRSNISALGLNSAAQLYRRGALDLGRRPGGLGDPFSIIFMDPPYHRGLIEPALAVLSSGDWLSDDALIIAETANDEELTVPGWTQLGERTIGAARFWFLRR